LTHNQAICTLCSATQHRDCRDVKELRHKSEECQASLKQRVAGLVTGIQQLDAARARLEQQQQDTQKKARDFLAEMRQVRDDVMSRATDWYMQVEDDVNNAVADVTHSAQRGKELFMQRKGRATSSRRTIERVHSSKNDGVIISMSALIVDQLNKLDLGVTLPSIIKPNSLSFDLDCDLIRRF
jgi:hypothetical protein